MGIGPIHGGANVRVTCTDADQFGLAPPALGFLQGEFDCELYHTAYQRRHPGGIYSISIQRVFGRLVELLDLVEKLDTSPPVGEPDVPPFSPELLRRLDAFLYAVMEHFDDCESIIECFIDPGDKKAAGKAKKKFWKGRPQKYRDHVGMIVNAIKHHQNRSNCMLLYTDQASLLCYFVEGVDEKGDVGPNKDIHPPGREYFSFFWDIRFHLLNLYFLSDDLLQYVRQLGEPISEHRAMDAIVPTLVESCIRRVCALPMVFANLERQRHVPEISIQQKRNQLVCTLRYRPPKECRRVKFHPRDTDIIATYSSDGTLGQSYRFPFAKR